jgi:hypothetical protein
VIKLLDAHIENHIIPPPKGARKGTQKGTRTVKEKEKDKEQDKDEDKDKEKEATFAQFWEQVPSKTGVGAARAAWEKALKKPEVTAKVIMAGLPKFHAYENRRKLKPDYTPLHPSTWINQERWADEIEGVLSTTTAPNAWKSDHEEMFGDPPPDDWEALSDSRKQAMLKRAARTGV